MANIHPTAIVDPGAELADDVEVRAGSIVESDVTIGPGTIIKEHAIIRRYTTMGAGNTVDSFVEIGGLPQDHAFDPDTVSYVTIGDNNVLRSGVTVHRATGEGNATVIGNDCMLMVNSHMGHNARIDDNVILVNGVLLAGWAIVNKRTILAGNAVVHQFCEIGEGCMFQGVSATSGHVPPYLLIAGVNKVIGLNLVGLRRNPEITPEDITDLKRAFRMLYRSGKPIPRAIEALQAETSWSPAAQKFVDFITRVMNYEGHFKRVLIAYDKS
jgi:UDP-N-acetylglucosamine acyltransferase